jgi:hypothetical protein
MTRPQVGTVDSLARGILFAGFWHNSIEGTCNQMIHKLRSPVGMAQGLVIAEEATEERIPCRDTFMGISWGLVGRRGRGDQERGGDETLLESMLRSLEKERFLADLLPRAGGRAPPPGGYILGPRPPGSRPGQRTMVSNQ